MSQTPDPAELVAKLQAHVQAGKPCESADYQELAARFTREVHGFAHGDVVDINDSDGRSDNMPMVVEMLELVETVGQLDPRMTPVRIRGPIFCANPEFDGKAGEGTCRPAFGEAFVRLN